MTDENKMPTWFYVIGLGTAVFITSFISKYIPLSPVKILDTLLSGLIGIALGYGIAIVITVFYSVILNKITEQVQKRIDSKGGETHE